MKAEEYITPIKVKVRLKYGQFSGETNKWFCTINGEKRVVTVRDVVWYCTSVEEAAKSFKKSEVESFNITGEWE